MSYRQRKSRRRNRHGVRSKMLLALGVIATVCVIGVLSLAGYVLAIASTAPNLSELKPVDKGQISVVYAADGSRLGYVQSDILRRVVPWADIPVDLRRATVAIEDERFYKHKGVDVNAIVRAGIKNLESGETVQGGSTITQQLVRALYIKDPKRNFARKIREAKLASELEDEHSKTWILENYLNSVPYGTVEGRTAIGAEAAAVTFFDKHAKNLDLDEAALLAGLTQAPSQYNPFRNPQAAVERRNEVLAKMRDNGYITSAEYEDAASQDLHLKRGRRYEQRREPYFFDYMQEQLIERYGVGVVRRGGLRIHTTIDPKMQDEARTAINSYYADPAGPSSAIVAIDPSNGKIRAMASSGTYGERRFNLAAQGHRQPGSAFKTFVLTAAIRKGIDPDSTTYTSKPLNLDDPAYGKWEVKTFGNTYIGTVSLTRATLLVGQHRLRPADPGHRAEGGLRDGQAARHHHQARLLPGRGAGRPDARGDHARDGGRVRDAGQRRRPAPGDRDRARGVPRRQEREPGQRRGQARFDRRPGLRGDQSPQDERPGGHRHAANYGCPAAGKTGTTDEAKDAWFVGYTPHLSAAVWVGYPDAGIAMPGAQGGTYAAPVWHAFMEVAHGEDCDDFPLPEHPAEFHPFFGKYAATGKAITTTPYGSQDGTTTDQSGGTGTDQHFDPRYYEQTPQNPPDVQAPQAQPPTDGAPQEPGSAGRRGARPVAPGPWPSST